MRVSEQNESGMPTKNSVLESVYWEEDQSLLEHIGNE